jgi:hypothetical protein
MENDAVYIEINPHEVNYVNRILEGYEYLGILTTIDPRRAVCCIHSTADTRQDVMDVMTHLDIPVKILSREETLEALGE